MSDINAALVGKLSEKFGARLMDCKKALTETQAEFGGILGIGGREEPCVWPGPIHDRD